MPAELWPLCVPSPLSSPLAARVKAAFDPSRILNPGILGESA
jgi:FAD/FMN-containing dehydrogenase